MQTKVLKVITFSNVKRPRFHFGIKCQATFIATFFKRLWGRFFLRVLHYKILCWNFIWVTIHRVGWYQGVGPTTFASLCVLWYALKNWRQGMPKLGNTLIFSFERDFSPMRSHKVNLFSPRACLFTPYLFWCHIPPWLRNFLWATHFHLTENTCCG